MDDIEYTPSELDGVEYFLHGDGESMLDLQNISESNSDGESMPDLESVSDSEEDFDMGDSDAESLSDLFDNHLSDNKCDANINRPASQDGEDRPLSSLTDDLADWVKVSINKWIINQQDTAEEQNTSSFDTAILANEAGSPEVEKELYGSATSRHMSPYRHKFINYTSIPPKSITAVDNGTFQAIGQGDIRISIPNGNSTATILLKGVLYAPKLGLTLVSISKITDAGFSSAMPSAGSSIRNAKSWVLSTRRTGHIVSIAPRSPAPESPPQVPSRPSRSKSFIAEWGTSPGSCQTSSQGRLGDRDQARRVHGDSILYMTQDMPSLRSGWSQTLYHSKQYSSV